MKTPGAIEAFLAPLAELAAERPDIEALVFWGDAQGWDTDPREALEAEEVAFYAEGLLLDGFQMIWVIAALADVPAIADHVRMWFWQDADPPPPLPPGWVALRHGTWPH